MKSKHPSHEPPAPRSYRDIQSTHDASDNLIPPESEWPQLPEGNPWKSDPVPNEPPLGNADCSDTVGTALGGAAR